MFAAANLLQVYYCRIQSAQKYLRITKNKIWIALEKNKMINTKYVSKQAELMSFKLMVESNEIFKFSLDCVLNLSATKANSKPLKGFAMAAKNNQQKKPFAQSKHTSNLASHNSLKPVILNHQLLSPVLMSISIINHHPYFIFLTLNTSSGSSMQLGFRRSLLQFQQQHSVQILANYMEESNQNAFLFHEGKPHFIKIGKFQDQEPLDIWEESEKEESIQLKKAFSILVCKEKRKFQSESNQSSQQSNLRPPFRVQFHKKIRMFPFRK